MKNLDKPGYYITESENLLILYPKGFFEPDMYSYSVCIEIESKEVWKQLSLNSNLWFNQHFPKNTLDIINKCLDFEYIGEL